MTPDRPIAADWLALRRTADSAARDQASALVDLVTADLPHRQITVLDVGAGTGANQAYLQPRLGRPSRWVLLDHDANLLLTAPGDVRVVGGVDDVDRLVEDHEIDLVTCSALLDLLTEAELRGLVSVLATRQVAGLFALSVDGTWQIDPPHPDDQALVAAFNVHQSREDRLGPRAPARLMSAATDLGMTVESRSTPWRLTADSNVLVARLLAERAAAAVEADPALAARADSWLQVRQGQLAAGTLVLTVGHVDLAVVAAS